MYTKRKHKATLEVQEYLCISTNDQNLRIKIAFNPATLTLDGVTSFFYNYWMVGNIRKIRVSVQNYALDSW